MALRLLIYALRRQLPIVILGMIVTVIGAGAVSRLPGVYQTRVDVVFLAPPATPSSNPFQGATASLISTAGLVARIVNQSSAASHTVSDSVTLAGQGITHGYSVRLPNRGGQWAYNFDRAVLDVEVSGRTEAEVRRGLATAIDRIETAVNAQQDAVSVPEGNRIRVQQSPMDPMVLYNTGSRMRAIVVTVLLGLAMTLSGATIAGERRRAITQARVDKVALQRL